MEVKKPTTFEEQLNKIKSRGCIIEDEEYALNILHQINYYRLTAYFLPFRKNDNTYKENTSFNKILRIYEFDKKLRYLLFPLIEELEVLLRAELSYYHSHKYGELGYTSADNFNEKHNHKLFTEKYESYIENNRKQLFVKHHINNYDSKFPLWVIIELFSFGEISRFYADMLRVDKKAFAKNVFGVQDKLLESWLYCLTRLRNSCAHYSRLYFNQFASVPLTPSKSKYKYKYKRNVFDYILILKNLCINKDKWNNSFLLQLSSLIEEYTDSITLSHIGFPDNWIDFLKII